MISPSVTFIMAARNAESTIRKSLESVLSQDYAGHVEVIVVDDASTDSTGHIVGEYPNVTLLKNERRLGRSMARNRALSAVKTALVAIQDADDISQPNRLSCTVPLISPVGPTVVGGQVTCMDPKTGVFQGGRWPTLDRATQDLLSQGRMPLAHPTMVLPLGVIKAVNGYDGRYPVAEDLDLLLRIKRRFPDVAFLNSSDSVALYQRGKLDTFRYLYQSAYWREKVMLSHYPTCSRPVTFSWISHSIEAYLRQRLKKLRATMKDNGTA